MVVKTEHQMPINDIKYAWTQDETLMMDEGPMTTTVYYGKCTCGQIFSGNDSSDIARQYVKHTNEFDF